MKCVLAWKLRLCAQTPRAGRAGPRPENAMAIHQDSRHLHGSLSSRTVVMGCCFLRQSVKNVLLCCRGTNRSGPEHFGCHRARTEVSSEHVHLLPGSLLAYKLHQHRHVRCHHPQSRQSLGWLNHFCNDNAHVRAFSLCGNTAGKRSELSHRRIPSRSGVHSLRVGRVAHILSKRIWRFGRNGRN